MIGFILKRFFQSFIVMFLVAMLAFTMFNFLGDPVNQMVGIDTSAADREALRDRLGLNDPLYAQFARFIGNALQFEFGQSYQHKRAVSGLILDRLPATLELSLISAIFTLAVGVPMGVHTGLHRNSLVSKIFMTVSLVGVSLPTFLIGILLIFIFSVQLQWLPSFGRGEVVDLGFWSTGLLTATGWKAIIMPAVTLGLFQMTLIMRLVRSEMLEVLRSDYIKFARARGLPSRAINFGHALKNTLVPVITIAGLQLGSLIAFAIITETVFQWPGMGLMFLQAIQVVDIPIMAAYLMLIAFFFVMINLIVDMLYYVVDPRLRVDSTN
ncbi:ABC transporter permease [Pelagibius sp. Alg239-R121]|uniref:ABC transporter permease n=1 Tax=Pelagibius sp. Alg239-R121 TaxID=2993448 RepID=UPI0024A6F0B6|nr:ABC transporter permease [Pelagibius sp. Alg239-R121]